MNYKSIIYQVLTVFILISILLLSGCKKDDGLVPGNGTFTDYGFIPAEVTVIAEIQSMIFNDGCLFVPTTDGIWKCNLTTREWVRSGLEGKSVESIYKHPEIANSFFAGVSTDNTSSFKTLYLSDDGGESWHAAANPVYNNLDDCYEDYECFAARPGHPEQIYANLAGGAMIAVSTDGGENWIRMNHADESYMGYPCNIVFLPGEGDVIYQGAEAPLDCARLGSFNINSSDPVTLEDFTIIIDWDTWSNRRPNELQTYDFTGNSLYVGQEGALSIVNGTSTRFIFKSEDDNNNPYTYIKGIWVDPDNPKHLLFGGMLNNEVQPMQLYETYDEGETIYRFTDKFGMENPCVLELTATSTYPAILISDLRRNKVKVLQYKP